MIKYQQQKGAFKSKQLASKFIVNTRGLQGNKMDRAYVKKTAEGWVIMVYTFPKAIQDKIEGIYRMRVELTTKVMGYYEIAAKPTSWIIAEHARLAKRAAKLYE